MESSKYSLYNGEIELEFNDAKHLYTANGKPAWGVTSVVGVLNKPALVYWAANMSADRFRELVKPGQSYGEVDIELMYNEIKSAHRRSSEKATTVGTLVHGAIEQIINALIAGNTKTSLPIDEKMLNCVNAFSAWVREHDVEFLASERKIFSKEHWYAGTLDVLARVDGDLSVVDIKTSSAVYPEYFYQTAAYCRAVQEEDQTPVKRSIILRVDKDGKGFEAVENGTIDESFEIFLACLRIYRHQMTKFDEGNK